MKQEKQVNEEPSNNFERFNPEAAKVITKQVHGLTLVWDEAAERFALPTSSKAQVKLLFDEPTDTFIQATVNDPDFYYRDRTAEGPDGVKVRERVFIGRRPKSGKLGDGYSDYEEVVIPDPEIEKAIIQAKILQIKRSFVESLAASQALFLFGLMASVVVLFYHIITGLHIVAEAFTVGAAPALGEVGYLAVWAVALVVGGLFLKYSVPFLFRSSGAKHYSSGSEEEDGDVDTSVNINITQNSGKGTQTFGAGTTAQGFVDSRKL